MFDMLNIFEVFLPQLLRYPNAADPLNGEASALMQQNPKAYNEKIKGSSIISSNWTAEPLERKIRLGVE